MGRLDGFERVEPSSRAEWRAWLEANHVRAEGVWLVMPKKGAGLEGVTLSDAVDEALCFGWVDSLPRKLDERRSMLLISPRKAGSNWSAVNKAKIARMIAAGRMHAAGTAKVEAAKADGTWVALDRVEALEVPEDLAAAFANMPPSATNWEAFPRSAKRGILEWILNARTPATRARRIGETARLAAEGKRANQWRG
jgi:uncharacterized protein YdeI (YjbR/CyaY-like superfamily)